MSGRTRRSACTLYGSDTQPFRVAAFQARCHTTPGLICWPRRADANNALDVGEPGFIRRPRMPDHAGSNPAIQTENGRASQRAMASGYYPDEHPALRVRLPLLPLLVPVAERPRRRSSKPDRRVRLPPGTLGDRLTVGCLALNQAMKVRTLLPEPADTWRCHLHERDFRARPREAYTPMTVLR